MVMKIPIAKPCVALGGCVLSFLIVRRCNATKERGYGRGG